MEVVFLDFFELVVVTLIILLFIRQIVVPLIFNTPMFPSFRKKPIFKEISKAEKEYQEAVLEQEAKRIKKAKEDLQKENSSTTK